MKTKILLYLTLIVGFVLFCGNAFSQEKMRTQVNTKVVQLDGRKIAIEHNNLMKEFFGKYLKLRKVKFPMSEHVFISELHGFLKSKSIGFPVGNNQSLIMAKDPISIIRNDVKNVELQKFLVKSFKLLIEASSDKEIKNIHKKIKEDILILKNDESVNFANVFVSFLENIPELYNSSEWESILKEFCNNDLSNYQYANVDWRDVWGYVMGAFHGDPIGWAVQASSMEILQYINEAMNER